MKSGQKKSVSRTFIQVFNFLKRKHKLLPVESLLECLEKIKPIFSLGYVTIAGKRREFPKFLSKHKQLQLATAWFYSCVLLRKERFLSQRIFNELRDLRLTKRHALVKRRDHLFVSAVGTRFNLRFTY
jgi:ribosomal protein S7